MVPFESNTETARRGRRFARRPGKRTEITLLERCLSFHIIPDVTVLPTPCGVATYAKSPSSSSWRCGSREDTLMTITRSLRKRHEEILNHRRGDKSSCRGSRILRKQSSYMSGLSGRSEEAIKNCRRTPEWQNAIIRHRDRKEIEERALRGRRTPEGNRKPEQNHRGSAGRTRNDMRGTIWIRTDHCRFSTSSR